MKDKAENTITTELAKQNVTETVIAKLKADYLPLKINGIEDKDGYKKVHDARIVCRDHRTLTEKICKLGREDAVKEQKAWIAKEKEVVAQISEVEQYLKKQEDTIDEQKEAIKIRAERLLKLPGRKEQLIGLEKYFEEDALDDDYIMTFTDEQWLKVVLLAKEKKLNAQQTEIDDANAKKLLERTVVRENEIIATGAVLYSDGLGKVYRKGNASVDEQTIKDCIDEGWPKIVEVFTNAVIPPRVEQTGNSVPRREGIHPSPPMINEVSDEENLFNYASALENIAVPIMKTGNGKEILRQANELLTQTITILRQ